MKIIKDSITNSSKYTQIHSTQYEDNKGEVKEWTWIGRPNNTKAIMIVPIVEGQYNKSGGLYVSNNKICVIREFRVSINDYLWEFPAGLIDPNENIEDSIRRELKEETGLTLDKIYHITPHVYNSPGITDETIAIAFVKASGTITKENLEASEDLEPYLFSSQEILTLLKDESKFGAKAILIMKYFAITNNIFYN